MKRMMKMVKLIINFFKNAYSSKEMSSKKYAEVPNVLQSSIEDDVFWGKILCSGS